MLKSCCAYADSAFNRLFKGDTGMDAVVARELKRISASLSVIEGRLAKIETEKEEHQEIRSNYPLMPFPAFDQDSSSLPI